jgi:hypothetical protein
MVHVTNVTPREVTSLLAGFPTWVFGDGTKLEGEKTLEELAKLSGMESQFDAASMAADFMGN